MYTQLIVAGIAALFFIIMARKYPILSAILYLIALMYLVWFSSGRGTSGGISIRFPLPFWRAIKNHHYGLNTNRSVLNIILFVPVGYIIPALCTKYRGKRRVNKGQKAVKWWLVVVAGLLCSFIIETCQLLFHRGVFELDDLVKNTMGTVVGWLIWKVESLRLHRKAVSGKTSNADS